MFEQQTDGIISALSFFFSCHETNSVNNLCHAVHRLRSRARDHGLHNETFIYVLCSPRAPGDVCWVSLACIFYLEAFILIQQWHSKRSGASGLVSHAGPRTWWAETRWQEFISVALRWAPECSAWHKQSASLERNVTARALCQKHLPSVSPHLWQHAIPSPPPPT